MTQKLKDILRTCACGLVALGLVAPACLAHGYSLSQATGSSGIGAPDGPSRPLQPQAAPGGTPPAPVFAQVTFGVSSIANDDRVPWSESPLTISMASPSNRDAPHLRIRYRLLGLETEWVETGERTIRYPRLEPGRYRFQAESVDESDGAVSAAAEINFRITRLWWQSGPMRLGLALLASMAVVLAWRWRVHLLVQQKLELERAVLDRTMALEREKAELVRAQERLRHYAEHDDLTGLWNHRIIIERLRQEVDRALRDASSLSVILVDLDHFKDVNDTFGHLSGDLVLKEISTIFAQSVRTYDWVGRYGGEEFLLILPGTSLVSACIRAEQFRMAVETARILDGKTAIHVTASFGVASGLPSDFESMLQTADTVLYRAKNNGRNCVVAAGIELPKDFVRPEE